MTAFAGLLDLPPGLAALAILTCFLAGLVRGFAGFGLSAVAMAVLASYLPPLELIPVFWFLEMAGSLVLMKGGWADAHRPTARLLIVSAGVGLPLGLIATMAIAPETSKLIALSLLVILAFAQLSRIRIPALDHPSGAGIAGLTGGIITGLAGAGGMFVALYTLARDLPARTMRGTMNIFLLGGGTVGLVTHLVLGTMTPEAVSRGILLILPALAGVFAGRALFTPRWERYYKPACLLLVIGLALTGLARLMFGATP